MANVKTLLIGIQDIDSIPYGATLRVKQLARTLRNTTYFNVGNKQWNSRSKFSKTLQLVRFGRPWTEPFCGYHFSMRKTFKLIKHLKSNKYDRIVLSEIWTYKYLSIVKRFAPSATIVFDFHNVESKLQEEHLVLHTEGFLKEYYEEWRLYLIKKMEREIVRIVDRIWVCSSDDAKQFDDIHTPYYKSIANIRIVPNAFQVNGQFQEHLTTEVSIGFVGCYNYPPNHDAALTLLYEIHPRTGGTLRLIGKNPSERLKAWSKNNVIVTGEVESITDELVKVRTLALPIYSGSGTRLKVLEAMAHGIPIVATKKAVEGLNMQDGIHYLNAESPNQFQETIHSLWSNPILEEFIRRNARDLVERKYSWEAVKE